MIRPVGEPLTAQEIAAGRREHPGLDGRSFVDHAAVSQISRGVQRAMAEQTERHVRNALLASRESELLYADGRERAAALVGARAARDGRVTTAAVRDAVDDRTRMGRSAPCSSTAVSASIWRRSESCAGATQRCSSSMAPRRSAR